MSAILQTDEITGRHQQPRGSVATVETMTYAAPARTAHGPIYWLLLGWWWGPTKWLGRVLLWVVFWPLGLWRSIVHGRDAQNSKLRRGARR